MILYFSGTGNSAYVAKRIGKAIDDEVVNLFEKIRSRNYSAMASSKPWIIVAPTYAWRIPRIVQKWLESTKLAGNRDIYFVLTCGGSIGNAGKYLEKLCAANALHYLGCAEIIMPENYIAMYSAPARNEAMEIIRQAEQIIGKAVRYIQNNTAFVQPTVTIRDKLNSGIVNDVFYPVCVHAKQFYASDACISCGKCANVCPLKNIRLEQGKPLWGKACTHCMACICRCPSEAIEYGKHSKGMVRYICPESVDV